MFVILNYDLCYQNIKLSEIDISQWSSYYYIMIVVSRHYHGIGNGTEQNNGNLNVWS